MNQASIIDRGAATHVQATRRTYDRIAPLYDWLDGIYERSWKRRLRAELFRHAHGRILDAGVSTGCNMPFYPAGAEVVGVDMSQRMLDRARERALALGRPVTLLPMNLLALDFLDASFDTVAYLGEAGLAPTQRMSYMSDGVTMAVLQPSGT